MGAYASQNHAEWSWTPAPHLEVIVVMVALGAGYLWALRHLGPRRVSPGTASATTRQKAAFFSGLALFWIGADWPMHDIAEGYLFSVHMVQHMIFSLMAPPLILLGMPRWLLRELLRPRAVAHIVRFFTRPLIAFLLFNGFVFFSHWPVIVEVSVTNEPAHLVVHLILVGSALAMWWPVIGPLPEFPRLQEGPRLLYLFLLSVPPVVPGSFLTFARSPIYPVYEQFPRSFGVGALSDQLFAGLLMKLGAGALLWGIITVLFFKWSAREERGDVETVTWDDFEHELEALNLRK